MLNVEAFRRRAADAGETGNAPQSCRRHGPHFGQFKTRGQPASAGGCDYYEITRRSAHAVPAGGGRVKAISFSAERPSSTLVPS